MNEKLILEKLALNVHAQLVALHKLGVEYARLKNNKVAVLFHLAALRFSQKAVLEHEADIEKLLKEK